MAATPKSNKIKRQEKGKKERLRRERENRESQSFAAIRAREEARIEKAVGLLAKSRAGTRNPKETIKALYNGEKVYLTTSSPFRTYSTMFDNMVNRSAMEREALFRLLSHCVDLDVHFVDRSGIFQPVGARTFANAISGVVMLHKDWLRPVEDWKPNSYNLYKQFSSLVRHLFAKYTIPLFFDDAFFTGNATHQSWFVHVGFGYNIRQAPHLPFALTKKAAHHMMTAPSDFDVNGALRWGQIHSMGGDERLVRAVLKTRAANLFTDNEFWESVFRWFKQNPMLDTAQYAPLIDYIYNQKFVPSVPNEVPNGPRLLPPQPNLSMKDRSVDATIRAMEEWHKQTGRIRKAGEKWWNASGIPEFNHVEGEHRKRLFTVTELLNAAELREEGSAMYHCVGSYSYSCATGRTSVWSIKQVEPDGTVIRLLTVEVDNQSRSIRQARGKYNEKPSSKASDIMNRWAAMSGLTISRWLI